MIKSVIPVQENYISVYRYSKYRNISAKNTGTPSLRYDTKRMRSREMDLIHSTGMTPDQIDGLREAFEQFDTKKSLSLNLGAIKRLFDKGAGSGKGFTFDRQRMVLECIFICKDAFFAAASA